MVARIAYVAIGIMSVVAGVSSFRGHHFSIWPWLGVWTALCLLLHRTYNVLLFPIYALQAYLMSLWMTFGGKERTLDSVVIATASTYILGRAAFFYQGNSNSPSTVDISGAYTGYVANGQFLNNLAAHEYSPLIDS